MATPAIKKIRHLKNVGVLEDIPVDGSDIEFSQFNVVYGFNGSGKSTICRLVESITEAGINENLPDNAEFSFRLSDGSAPSNASPVNAASRQIAVFSEDFVDRSLAWKSGAAQPIIYLGEEQADLAKSLETLEQRESNLAPVQAQRAGEWSFCQKAVDTHCRERARLISEELGLGRKYSAPNLRADYGDNTLGPHDKRSETERAALKEIIWRTDSPTTIRALDVAICLSHLQAQVSDAIAITVQKITIDALERRKDALPWVQRGLEIHASEHDCLFCGSSLTIERRESLTQALSGSFEALASRVSNLTTEVEILRETCAAARIAVQAVPDVVPELRQEMREKNDEVRSLVEAAHAASETWLHALSEKRRDPGFSGSFGDDLNKVGWDSALAEATAARNEIISRHNGFVQNFEAEKTGAASKLRRHYLHDGHAMYGDLAAAETAAKSELEGLDRQLLDVRQKIAGVRNQLKVHGPAAKQLNKLLKSYLGHNKITLAPTNEGYEICRDGKPSTKPLSEGEKTAVAFFYFVTSLTADGRKIEDMIVVIDDPISSLDTRAMSHVVGMIRIRFAKCAQFFILTHNLDFMREMKKWLGRKRQEGEAAFLFIETRIYEDESRSSKIVEMPALIREYESEYHYLFSLMCMLVADPEKAGGFLYLLPNAMRKVLETFLAFKQPGFADLQGLEKLLELHPDIDAERVKGMELLVQAESHSQSIGNSVSFSAYTLEQITEAAKTLMALIEIADKPHYDRMRRLCRG